MSKNIALKAISVAQDLSDALTAFDAALAADGHKLPEKATPTHERLRKVSAIAVRLLLDIGSKDFQRTIADTRAKFK